MGRHDPVHLCKKPDCGNRARNANDLCPEHHAERRERSHRDRTAPRCVICGNQTGKRQAEEGDPNRPLCTTHMIQEEHASNEAAYRREREQERIAEWERVKTEAKSRGCDVEVYKFLREQVYCGVSSDKVLLELLNYIIERKS